MLNVVVLSVLATALVEGWIITSGCCQQIREETLRVRNPHDLGRRVGMIEGALGGELRRFLVERDDLEVGHTDN